MMAAALRQVLVQGLLLGVLLAVLLHQPGHPPEQRRPEPDEPLGATR